MKNWVKEHIFLISVICEAIVLLVCIICPIVTFGYGVLVAIVFTALEVALAYCLHKMPIWGHGLVVIAMIVAGICFAKLYFMIFMTVVYVATTVFLYFADKEGKLFAKAN